MESLELLLTTINKWLWGRWLVYVLLGLGILYTFTNGFIQVRYFKFIIKKHWQILLKQEMMKKVQVQFQHSKQ